jgi:hypothetical protein
VREFCRNDNPAEELERERREDVPEPLEDLLPEFEA